MALRYWLKSRKRRRDWKRQQQQARRPNGNQMDGKTSSHNPRLNLVYVLIGLSLTFLAAALGANQLIMAPEYREAEERQNYRRILMPGPRGNIYDREGRLLVGNRPIFKAVVSLNELRPEFRVEYFRLLNEAREKNQRINRTLINTTARAAVVQRYLNQLNLLLGRNETVSDRLERHFRQSLLLPFPLINDLTAVEFARVIEHIPVESPIQVITESARYYPYGEAAAHVLGFVSSTTEIPATEVSEADLLTFTFEGKIGRSGLERSFDEVLQGQSGGEIWSVDPGGFQAERIEHRPPIKGGDLYTTLDIDLQLAAEKAMGDKTGAIVALDIQTGEVLTLASRPAYDLNDLSPFLSHAIDQQIREEGGWLNRATQGLYPPGSTFKLVTAYAGLREGVITADTEINCPGFHIVGGRRFHCHRRIGHGWENLAGAIRDSCNVFFYDRALAMGVGPLAAEAIRFGLDQPTGIEIPGETRSMLVPDPAWKKERLYTSWFGGDTANFSIGQGYLLVTPLQMATFVASVARNETRTRPTLLLRGPDGLVAQPDFTRESTGLAPEDYAIIIDGMRQSGQTGTGRLAGTAEMMAAGKTGTAQIRKEGRPTTLAWYVGFAPADNPRIAIAVLIEGVPDTSYGGGATAAPMARAVFEAYTRKQPQSPTVVQQPGESPGRTR